MGFEDAWLHDAPVDYRPATSFSAWTSRQSRACAAGVLPEAPAGACRSSLSCTTCCVFSCPNISVPALPRISPSGWTSSRRATVRSAFRRPSRAIWLDGWRNMRRSAQPASRSTGSTWVRIFKIPSHRRASRRCRELAGDAEEITVLPDGRDAGASQGACADPGCIRTAVAGKSAGQPCPGGQARLVGRGSGPRLKRHPELGRRLFWLEGISDEYLEALYAASSCLIAGSYGEGFGLPLIEAAQHGISIIARDIPVFREVAGDHAYYFSSETGQDLAVEINAWLELESRGRRLRPKAWLI